MTARYRYITRLHYDSSHGWWVRMHFAGIQKLFTDLACGSKAKSLKAAITFRDQTIRGLKRKGMRIGRKPKGHHLHPTSKSSTGIVGVHCTVKTRSDGTPSKSFIGTYYPVKYKHRSKSFSVSKYGTKQARQLAIAFRREGIRSLEKQRRNR